MFRLYDWKCDKCGSVQEFVSQIQQGFEAPKAIVIPCKKCKKKLLHVRMLPLLGPYYGEKPQNPIVYGGQFDTAGHEKLPELPKMPDLDSWSDTKDYFKSKEFQSAKKRRNEVKKRNKAKRERLRLLRSGANINMRVDRLPGDPKIMS